MVPGGGPGAYRTGLLLLMLLILPGNGNEGSKAGNCYCMKTFPSNSPPTADQLKALRKRLEEYNQCFGYARFRLRSRSSSQPKLYSVCGGSQDPWVLDLISCYEKKECGHHSQSQSMARQEHLLPPNHQVPESTEKTSWNTSTPTQTAPSPTLQSTQQPTLPAATPSFEKNFTHNSETTTSTVGPSLHAALEIREQEKGNKGSAAGASALVAVLSLLGIVFILIIIILYLKCKRQKSCHNSPDLELPLAPDSTAQTKNGNL